MLTIETLELTNIMAVEEFCQGLYKRFKRIHILINNAAQTITRPKDWIDKMNFIEHETLPLLTDKATELLSLSALSLPKLLTSSNSSDDNNSSSTTSDNNSSSDDNRNNNTSTKLATRHKTSKGIIIIITVTIIIIIIIITTTLIIIITI